MILMRESRFEMFLGRTQCLISVLLQANMSLFDILTAVGTTIFKSPSICFHQKHNWIRKYCDIVSHMNYDLCILIDQKTNEGLHITQKFHC